MSKVELSGGSSLSRLARNEAKIISYLNSIEPVMPTNRQPQWKDDIILTAEQRTSILKRFRDEPDIPVGASKEELPTMQDVPEWAEH